MAQSFDVAVVVGSLRKESLNRKVALALAQLAPPALRLELVEIGDLPLYNQDLEEHDTPASWTRFRDRIKAADAVLFVTPEYNRSVPSAMKNALDVGSRPFGKNAWNGKPGAVISVSPGALGGVAANHHLRQSLVSLNVAVLPQPEVYLGGAGNLFDPEGRIANESTQAFLRSFTEAFLIWVQRNGSGA
ncbi:NAD(P)H-dependent oxidoreductase [Microvirga zambiensis]|uniref:NAD(P)H-dependent oxidoreductase n=1 Tax=Microvirga zambiensis TaxID=1402137 RepID=UPI00191D54E6